MTLPRLALILCALALLTGAGALFASSPPPTAIEWNDHSVSELRGSMQSVVRELGGMEAYAAFKARYATTSFDAAHNAAHLFGESMYDEEGVAAVAACDADFNFGCYHGFFSAAVASEGLEVVAALDAACGGPEVPRSNACQHGIGHGILEYLGHARLVEALEACALTNQPDPLAGCTGGVFMEYNVPLISNADGSFTLTTRTFDEALGPYAPCPELPERFRGSCYQELPQWWHQAFSEDFARMGALCDAVADPYLARTCVMGIGKIIPSSADYSVEHSLSFCDLMPPTRRDLCITQAAWSFESNTPTHEKALALCAYASEAAQAECPK